MCEKWATYSQQVLLSEHTHCAKWFSHMVAAVTGSELLLLDSNTQQKIQILNNQLTQTEHNNIQVSAVDNFIIHFTSDKIRCMAVN